MDAFTVAAQVANFVILLVLLRRFLYRPVLEAVERREAALSERARRAEELHEAAQAAEERIRSEQAALESQRLAALRRADEEAERHKAELLERTRAEAAEARARWQEGLSREKEGVLQSLREATVTELHQSLDRALKDLAGESLQERMVDAFVQRLDTLDPADREELRDASSVAHGRVEVRSAQELAARASEKLVGALERVVGTSVVPEFSVAPELVAGVEVRVGDRKLAWSVGDYVDRLERATRARLQDAERGG